MEPPCGSLNNLIYERAKESATETAAKVTDLVSDFGFDFLPKSADTAAKIATIAAAPTNSQVELTDS